MYREGHDLSDIASDCVTRHEAVYSTPGLPAFECSLVDDRIMAGRNPLTERDAAWLTAAGVTHILDLREDWEWAAPRFGAEAVRCLGPMRTHLPVRDMQAPTSADLDAACQFLTEHVSALQKLVYIHCRAGQERTAAVLIAYVARRDGFTYDDALAVLKQRRPTLRPLPVQEHAVRAWLLQHVE
jgi:protein-tyrosine phosphatase